MSNKLKTLSAKLGSDKIDQTLTGTLASNILRILFVIHIATTSYLPYHYLAVLNNVITRTLLSLGVVLLLFYDVISALLLALALVMAVQEYHVKHAQHMHNADKRKAIGFFESLMELLTLASSDNVPTTANTSIDTAMPIQTTATSSTDDSPKLIANSAYGKIQMPPMDTSNERLGKYLGQIGNLEITTELDNGVGVQIENGEKVFKNNMGQSTSGKDTMMDVGSATPTYNLGTTYDNPADKTITENCRMANTGYITEQNLLDAQINSVFGADGSTPPCAISTVPGIWNAQGFGGIATPLDKDACQFSVVNPSVAL